MIARYKRWLIENGVTTDQMSYDEWLASEYPDNVAIQRLHKTSASVAGDIPRDESVIKVVVEDADTDLKASLAALARSRMSRISNLVSYADAVEQRLMERVDLNEASLDQLLATARYLRSSAKDDISLVLNVVETSNQQKGLDGAQFNQFNINIPASAGSTLDSRDGRDRTRSVLDGFVQVLNKIDDTNSSPAVSDSRPADSDQQTPPGT